MDFRVGNTTDCLKRKWRMLASKGQSTVNQVYRLCDFSDMIHLESFPLVFFSRTAGWCVTSKSKLVWLLQPLEQRWPPFAGWGSHVSATNRIRTDSFQGQCRRDKLQAIYGESKHVCFSLLWLDKWLRGYFINCIKLCSVHPGWQKKCLSCNFHIWKKCLSYSFIQFHRAKVKVWKYQNKHFFHTWNCMISIFSINDNTKKIVSKLRVSTKTLTKNFLSEDNPECTWQLPRR